MATPAGGHYEGMPQLDPAFTGNLLFWLVVTMVAIYYLLNRVALPRIAGIIEDRQAAIASDLDKAAELKAEAETAEESYQQALKDARAEAQRIAGKTKADIQAELDLAIEKADAEIAARSAQSETRIAEIRDSAGAAVAEVAKATAREIVAATSPAKVDQARIDAAVAAQMEGRG